MVHCFFVSKEGNGPNPDKTFGFRYRPEREPIELGERTSGQKPTRTDELVEKESSQGQTERRRIWGTRAKFSCYGEVPLSKLWPQVEEIVWRPGGCLCIPTIPLPISHHSNHRSILKRERFAALKEQVFGTEEDGHVPAWRKCTDQGKRQVDVLSSGILSVTEEITEERQRALELRDPS